jgi:hypothetical protein
MHCDSEWSLGRDAIRWIHGAVACAGTQKQHLSGSWLPPRGCTVWRKMIISTPFQVWKKNMEYSWTKKFFYVNCTSATRDIVLRPKSWDPVNTPCTYCSASAQDVRLVATKCPEKERKTPLFPRLLFYLLSSLLWESLISLLLWESLKKNDADTEFNFFYTPTAGRGRSYGLFPWNTPLFPRLLSY